VLDPSDVDLAPVGARGEEMLAAVCSGQHGVEEKPYLRSRSDGMRLSLGARGESRGRRERVRLGGLARRGERAEEGAGGALDLMERSMRVVISVISNSRWVSRPCT
jgi:hypothetical protein